MSRLPPGRFLPSMSLISRPVVISAAAARCALGDSLASMCETMLAGRTGLRPLRELSEMAAEPFASMSAGMLRDRSVLLGRKYGAATNLAVRIARDVLHEAGWTPQETKEAWVFGGSSRGNFGELLGAHHGRRPMKIYAPSNSLNSEISAAVSIECGITAPWQMLSNGCASGLDAILWAAHSVACGMAPRALVVSVELPLAPLLLRDFQRTGLINSNGLNDPYSPETTGFFPAEAAAALTIEPDGPGSQIIGGWMNSDAFDPMALPPDGSGVQALLGKFWQEYQDLDASPAICPHASGTKAHGQAEFAALRAILKANAPAPSSVHLIKPFTGHSLGANGLLDCAILHEFLTKNQLPPNLPGLSGQCPEFRLPDHPEPANGRIVLKLSGGMGGRNSLIAMRRPHA